MGLVCSKKRPIRHSFIPSTNQSIQISPQADIDLPYRHYIDFNLYIASSLPHSKFEYKPKSAVRIQGNIKSSSIIQRRSSNQLYSQQMITINQQSQFAKH